MGAEQQRSSRQVKGQSGRARTTVVEKWVEVVVVVVVVVVEMVIVMMMHGG